MDRRLWVVRTLAIAFVTAAFVIAAFVPLTSSSEANGAAIGLPPANASAGQLARYRAVAQIELAEAQRDQLRQQAQSARAADSPWRVWLPVIATVVGALATALVAYLAVILPLRSQRQKDREERKRAADQEIAQRASAAAEDAAERRKDLVHRFDVSFATAVAAVADPMPAAQAGGAAALQGFLRPELAEFRRELYLVVRAHLDLGIKHPDAVRAVLVATLEVLLRESHGSPTPSSRPRSASSGRPVGINLTRAWLCRADLRGLDLQTADLWRSDLRHARFDGASLRRAHGWKAHLDGASFRGADLEEARLRAVRAPAANFNQARLVSARLEEAVLDRATFRAAKLQGAHLQMAKLRAADFRDADVRDASFAGATFDDVTLTSLVLARNLWRADPQTGRGSFTAELDPDAGARLRVLAARRGWQWVPA